MPTCEFKCQGETFLFDDSEGCLIKVTYAENPQQVGWVGVNVVERDKDYPYAITDDNRCFTKDGVTVANGGRAATVENAVERCCQNILRKLERRKFDAEAACNEIHNWMRERNN